MKRIALFSAVLLVVALPAFAASASFELTGWASWVNTNSSTAFNSSAPNQPFGISIHNKVGDGAGANIFWLRNISTDFSVVEVRPSSRFVNTESGTIAGPNLRMTPITGIVQLHFSPAGFVDPYVGAGAAYVLFDNVSGPASLGGEPHPHQERRRLRDQRRSADRDRAESRGHCRWQVCAAARRDHGGLQRRAEGHLSVQDQPGDFLGGPDVPVLSN